MSGGFLERWSRRKLEAKERPEDEALPPEAEAPAAAQGEPGRAADPSGVPAASRDGAPEPQDEGDAISEEELAALPPIESFTLETDLAPFLRRGVPKALKNAAMRKMWLLDPVIRDHRDVAVDYAWDWNTPGGVPGNDGVISPESARKMFEALTAKPPEPAPAASAAAAPDAVEAPREEGAERSEEAAPGPDAAPQAAAEAERPGPDGDSPVARLEAGVPVVPVEARRDSAQAAGDATFRHQPSAQPSVAPRGRRHGGAVPS